MNYWQSEIDELVNAFNSDREQGLTTQEAKQKLEKYGLNQLKEAKSISPLSIFIDQYKDFIVWVLIVSAIVSGFLGEWIDSIVIIVTVMLNGVLGFIQEFRAEKSLQALKKLSSPNSKVIRDGMHNTIPSSGLVPGDLIELEAGDNVPADSRIAWLTTNFSALESSLTGESTPVLKTKMALEEKKEIPLADRANMIYMGTSISNGKARALVVETGMNTELGKIAEMIQNIEEEDTPLQKKLEQFGKLIVYICFVLIAIIFLLGILRGGNILELFMTAVSLAVAAIPEGLPAIVTISLALGVQRMVKRHALIRKLPSVETLGSATVICSDKTGTLTKNEMTVQAVYAGGDLFKITGIGYEPRGEFLLDQKQINPQNYPDLNKTLLSGVLCNGAQLIKNESYKIYGDPTEGSILTAAGKANLWKEEKEKEFIFVDEIPFDSERKKMTIIRKNNNQLIAFTKGAPDILLNDCAYIEEKGIIRKINESDLKNILKVNDQLAGEAMRVLAIGYRNPNNDISKFEAKEIEKDLTFIGLVAMIDPPRPEAKKAIKECITAGIKTVMITGDHKNTAIAIARALGFFNENSIGLTGEDMDKLNEEEFNKIVKNISVYARVSPEHKLRIVKAWRKYNEIVAMTGDGVNDAPAVKEADIGVAMGITGTDVTKEVSSMIVTDDNFASIVSAVEEGRGIYDNIKKFILYLLSCNAGEILVMFIASVLALPIPLLPIHILWVNLVTDGLPAFALGVDPVDKNIMNRPPLPVNESIITRKIGIILSLQGLIIALCSLFTFIYFLYVAKESLIHARTGAFIVLACSQLFHSFNFRSAKESLFKIGVFTNSKLVAATLISFLLQMAAVYISFLQKIFKTDPLQLHHLILVIFISSLPLWIMEITKGMNKILTKRWLE
ncbi:cation-translocating P-type ATPase [Candidatus Poribacteria bacterium]|nr:cation-translocating P-type ATPase [Candidatus Poribacteria bacterium]